MAQATFAKVLSSRSAHFCWSTSINRQFLAVPACARLFAALLGLLVSCGHAAAPQLGEIAPSWTLSDIDGHSVSFPADDSGQAAILMFWTAWCPYCKALMPRLSALAEELQVPAYAMRFYDEGEALPAAQPGLTLLVGGDAVAGRYAVEMVPALYIVDGEGRIIYRLDYPESDHPSQQIRNTTQKAQALAVWWEQRIRQVLQETLPDPM